MRASCLVRPRGRVLTAACATAAAVSLWNGAAAAQTPPRPRPAEVEQIRQRQRISLMEGVLERAVANGADNLLRQVKHFMPEVPMLTGAPEVRGFRLSASSWA